MYSLYRAWLGLGGPCSSLPNTLPMLSPSLQTSPASYGNPNQINGAPDVTLQVGPSLTHFAAHRAILSAHSGFFKAALANQQPENNPIAVPNVNVDEFSSLLTFMYTGYLDLNITNIYNILLATHILHMPRALEVCRSFLIQHHPLDVRPNLTQVIKPIPSRKSALPHPQIYPPLFGSLQKSEETPFRTITVEKQNYIGSEREKSENLQREKPSAVPESCQRKPPLPEKFNNKNKDKRRAESTNEKVIIDIACCDGPVRFHRVLNKSYGLSNVENDFTFEEINRTDLMNKVMNASIRDRQNEAQTTTNEVFTCVYCNHTFKSQYCYQKHARRHLNPVNVEAKSIQKIENCAKSTREVKLLDMNVQYYPCKTCGSKFPSYYFVHKHRKMCHAEEVADSETVNESDDKGESETVVENVESTDIEVADA